MTSAGHQDLVVTRATLDDWAVVARWAGEEGWNPGLRDPACFFAQDPEGFFIGRIDGEPVSSVSVVTYGDHHAFLGFYLVRPDLRGRGHGLTTWKTALAHAGDRTVGLDGVVAQQDNYRLSGFEPAHRTFRYAGVIPGAAALPDGVRPVRDAASLAAYDSACHPADRPRFLQRWLTADGHRALARIVTGGSPATASSARAGTPCGSAPCSPTPPPTPARSSPGSPPRRRAVNWLSTCRSRTRPPSRWWRSTG
ncbi:acetyltransferase [Streptomyces bottropensis ATCC 25435]|uniref:Acetyltransferase n=1 Tax=Streptomyces bottropensis ATCC 25435 TaxID=1054862 RepID=M3FZZ3_9ACTN|nr:acetyltransferase [Streptomyces bottropensis ATCC 25435]